MNIILVFERNFFPFHSTSIDNVKKNFFDSKSISSVLIKKQAFSVTIVRDVAVIICSFFYRLTTLARALFV